MAHKIARTCREEPSEAAQVQAIRLALGHIVRLDKNPVGSFTTEAGQTISYGLGVGSADLVGDILLVFPEIHRELPIVFCLEVKKPGRRGEKNRGCSDAQVMWRKMIRARNGWCDVVDSVEEALDSVKRCVAHYGASAVISPGGALCAVN